MQHGSLLVRGLRHVHRLLGIRREALRLVVDMCFDISVGLAADAARASVTALVNYGNQPCDCASHVSKVRGAREGGERRTCSNAEHHKSNRRKRVSAAAVGAPVVVLGSEWYVVDT